MRDTSQAAARVLRAVLAVAVVTILAGILLTTSPLASRLTLVGLWTIVAGPFLVLTIVSAAKPRTRWFAAGTLILALIGFLLAR